MKKCPPGMICVENITMTLVFIALFVIIYFIYNISTKNKKNDETVININQHQTETTKSNGGLLNYLMPSWPYTNFPGEGVLLDPRVPPLKDERYLTNVGISAVPINVSTNINAVDTNYRQVGIMTPLNGPNKDNILPLMGRPLFTSRQKWQYYTISNQHNNVKLPVLVKGRQGLNDNGVDEIYSADTVYVEGYGEPFKVTLYESNTIKYLPFV